MDYTGCSKLAAGLCIHIQRLVRAASLFWTLTWAVRQQSISTQRHNVTPGDGIDQHINEARKAGWGTHSRELSGESALTC